MTDRVTVQVVDDHFLFASSLASVIKEIERYRLVGIAVTGPQALAMVREERPDIVLLDFHLPGYSADMLIPRFLSVSPATRVIVLTSDTSDGAMVSALQAGAIGFMTKDKAIDDVLEALRVVADGGTLLTPRQLELAGSSGGGAGPTTLPRSAPQPPAARPTAPLRPPLPEAAPTSLTFTPAPMPLPRPDPIELRLVGVGSFAQAVLIERFIDRLPQVEQVYIRDLLGDRASLRVALNPGASPDALAKELVDGSRRLRVTGVERGMLELQVEAPLIDG
ncbi:MAG TPA: response regulator transcription factor [Candidatus Limnocylindria bacterium]|nr:response regulator transcription factor [Candidatus Limnocylindria bacterium]